MGVGMLHLYAAHCGETEQPSSQDGMLNERAKLTLARLLKKVSTQIKLLFSANL
jgi:hypothetical protein